MKYASVWVSLGCLALSVNASANLLVDGKQRSIQDVAPRYANQLYRVQMKAYEEEKKILEDALLDQYFQDEARRKKLDEKQLKADILQVKDPADAELKSFYQENKDRIRQPLDAIRDDLRNFLKQRKEAEAKQDLLLRLEKKGRYRVVLNQPQQPKFEIRTKSFFSRGKKGSKVQVVEFADYRCPHCRSASLLFEDLYEAYGKSVEFVFIDFPVLKGLSHDVAKAAYCAGEQKKFWPYHKKAFERQASLNPTELETLAKELNLDLDSFNACRSSQAASDFVDKGAQEADRLGLSGTPSFFVNGKLVLNTSKLELTRLIDQELKTSH
ncbi:DsbA family protein [Pseudobacteriovorax antillogorgiicola]|uniref:Thioredoxin n=1 Tax=Pseudobacteriovorax antillogorgiicola TaxID=1513793 RepID=A0A1Y6BC02_9BACT|nr:thioredoxin domain-containing protein [Pseudobacteriovorax antillogorgiicola]TCS58921.1 thioredoxin-like protein [Pseudobacteriovorax antillogorgiicola]SME93125.1 Thioredoxin [Pseudobacteriovorax antillogorgiicola]